MSDQSQLTRKQILDRIQILVESIMTTDFCARHHLESYNTFILKDLPEIVHANRTIYSDIDPNFYLQYKSIKMTKPTFEEDMNSRCILPNECRLRDLSYSANLYADIEYIKDKKPVIKTDVFLGKIPVMLKSILCHLNQSDQSIFTIKNEELRINEKFKIINNVKNRTKECPSDFGGYFIVNGVERVILIQEQLSKNRIIIEPDKKVGRIASVTSSTIQRKSKTGVYMNKFGVLSLKSNIFPSDVPLIVVIKAFGLICDKTIAEYIGFEQHILEKIEASLENCSKDQIFTQNQALDFLGKDVNNIRRVLNDVILPNVPNENADQSRKAITLCLMARFLLLNDKVDDIDFLGNKRFELSGQLLSLLFEDTFIRFNYELKKQIDKVLSRTRSDNFDAISYLLLQANLITNGFNKAISTGNWILKRFRMEKKGVTQVLSRLSYTSSVGMLTRIQAQFEKTRKVSGPRALHTSSFGVFCPNDTPEGESCGLVKNLSLLACITTENPNLKIDSNFSINLDTFNSNESNIEDHLFKFNLISIKELSPQEIHSGHLVFLNGSLIGVTYNQNQFIYKVKKIKAMFPFISVSYCSEKNILNVSTDGGRICRPFFNLENLISLEDIWLLENNYKCVNDFFREGKLEYLDVNEMGSSYVSFFDYKRFLTSETKVELQHRNNFVGNEQVKQETFDFKSQNVFNLDTTHPNYRVNETTFNERSLNLLNNQLNDLNEKLQNIFIEDPNYTHMEISDYTLLGYIASLIPFPNHNQSPRNTYQCAMSKQAMGIIHTFYKDRFDTVLNILTYAQMPICKTRTKPFMPSGINAMVCVMSYSGYDIEDALILNKSSVERGFGMCEVYKTFKQEIKEFSDGTKQKLVFNVQPGEWVKENDYFIELIHNNKPSGERYKGLDKAILDTIYVAKSNTTIVKAKLRQIRKPELGDKFSSRHGQKGVVGLIVDENDLPFSDNGLRPDIIMNPHGYPSRMTVGKILELVYGKKGLINGTFQDTTIFSSENSNFTINTEENNPSSLFNVLQSNGFNYTGKETFYCGITGEIMEGYVFYGPIYYQRLKHMVADKMHSRARGPKALLTRQPTEGRSKDGGLRLGEMERDCLVGYGVSQVLLERLVYSSDGTKVIFCDGCGLLYTKEWCCGNKVEYFMPYAYKLLLFELLSMNIVVRMKFSK